MPNTELAERFIANATAVGARCDLVTETDLSKKLRQLIQEMAITRIATSESGLVVASLAGTERRELVGPTGDRDDLFAADAGITEAQWGIAETGTLVLESATERNRVASLVPPVHIALLPVSRILGSMSDVLSRVSTTKNQAVTFVTGPSRTADIELTLVVGVHGPRDLHILVLSDR